MKPKAYKTEFRTRFCESLLAKYVLVVEGRTEFDALPAAARRLCELEPSKYKTLEHLGVAIIDAEGETNVAPLGAFFKNLGKTVFAVFDKQTPAGLSAIQASVDHAYESQLKGFEDVVLTQVTEAALRSYALELVAANQWPTHMAAKQPSAGMALSDLQDALRGFFGWSKGSGDAGDLLASCRTAADMPQYVRDTLAAIVNVVELPPSTPAAPTSITTGAEVMGTAATAATAASTPAVPAAAPGAAVLVAQVYGRWLRPSKVQPGRAAAETYAQEWVEAKGLVSLEDPTMFEEEAAQEDSEVALAGDTEDDEEDV